MVATNNCHWFALQGMFIWNIRNKYSSNVDWLLWLGTRYSHLTNHYNIWGGRASPPHGTCLSFTTVTIAIMLYLLYCTSPKCGRLYIILLEACHCIRSRLFGIAFDLLLEWNFLKYFYTSVHDLTHWNVHYHKNSITLIFNGYSYSNLDLSLSCKIQIGS